MALINPTVPTIGDPNSTEAVDIRNAFIAILAEINGNIDNNNIKSGAAIAHSKLANTTAGQLLIANASGVITGTALGGDVTSDGSGVVTIGDNKITKAKMADAAIGDPEVDASVPIVGAKLDTLDGRLKQTTGLVSASADLTLTTSYQDIASATADITPDVSATILVYAVFDFYMQQLVIKDTSELDARLAGTVVVDGVAETKVARLGAGGVSASSGGGGAGADITFQNRGTVIQIYKINLSAAAHTLKLQAKIESHGSSGTLDVATCKSAGTQMFYQLIAQ